MLIYTQESLRDAQVNLRKHVQENESLEFRNQQLSKRVVLLQEDVNSPSKNKKKRVRQARFILSFVLTIGWDRQYGC